jgi:hypothetical protein
MIPKDRLMVLAVPAVNPQYQRGLNVRNRGKNQVPCVGDLVRGIFLSMGSGIQLILVNSSMNLNKRNKVAVNGLCLPHPTTVPSNRNVLCLV